MADVKTWWVWCPEDDESGADAVKVHADCDYEAAEEWARNDDPESNYRLLEKCVSLTVHVREEGRDEVTRWRVTGEAVATYYAEEIEEEPRMKAVVVPAKDLDNDLRARTYVTPTADVDHEIAFWRKKVVEAAQMLVLLQGERAEIVARHKAKTVTVIG